MRTALFLGIYQPGPSIEKSEPFGFAFGIFLGLGNDDCPGRFSHHTSDFSVEEVDAPLAGFRIRRPHAVD